MALEARLKRIEDMEGKLNPHRQHRFCRIAADDEEEAAIRQEITDLGFDPDKDLFLIKLVSLEANEVMQ